jgi:hypothetical protein
MTLRSSEPSPSARREPADSATVMAFPLTRCGLWLTS